MHACLLHVYDHAFTSFIVYCFLFSRIGHGFVHVRFCPNRDRSIVMLTSRVRLYLVSHFKVPEWFLVCWQIASYSYMSSHMAFLAVNMELSGTTRQVPSFGI
jgi:hypothetical protein